MRVQNQRDPLQLRGSRESLKKVNRDREKEATWAFSVRRTEMTPGVAAAVTHHRRSHYLKPRLALSAHVCSSKPSIKHSVWVPLFMSFPVTSVVQNLVELLQLPGLEEDRAFQKEIGLKTLVFKAYR